MTQPPEPQTAEEALAKARELEQAAQALDRESAAEPAAEHRRQAAQMRARARELARIERQVKRRRDSEAVSKMRDQRRAARGGAA